MTLDTNWYVIFIDENEIGQWFMELSRTKYLIIIS